MNTHYVAIALLSAASIFVPAVAQPIVATKPQCATEAGAKFAPNPR